MPDARVRVYAYTYMYDCLVAQPPRRQPLCLLRPPGRQSVAVSCAAALCFSYVNLCSYVPAVSGKHERYLMFLCPYVLLSPALAAAQPRHDISTFPQQPQRAERAIFHPEQQKIRPPATENPPAHNILRHLILTLQRTWYGLDKALCQM